MRLIIKGQGNESPIRSCKVKLPLTRLVMVCNVNTSLLCIIESRGARNEDSIQLGRRGVVQGSGPEESTQTMVILLMDFDV